jgi:hypothetical protein
MPNPDDYSPLPAPPTPVVPPTLPPDFPDIPQNPSSDLQPPPPPSANPDEVAGATLDPTESEVQKGLATPTGRHSTHCHPCRSTSPSVASPLNNGSSDGERRGCEQPEFVLKLRSRNA